MSMFEEHIVKEDSLQVESINWNKYIDPWSRTAHIERAKVVAVDFDETISDDPEAWLRVMRTLEVCGYTVYVCTWRYPHESEELQFLVAKGYRIFYTGRKAKKPFMLSKGIEVAIWVDDNPFAVENDCRPDLITYN